MRIGILGHVGTNNLGDEAIVAAVVQNLRARYPDTEIIAFTANPEDTQRRHGIPAFPLRRRDRRASPSVESAKSPSDAWEGFLSKVKGTLKRVPPVFAAVRQAWELVRNVGAGWDELGVVAQHYRRLRGVRLLVIMGSQQLNDYFGGSFGFPYTLLKWTLLARARGARVALLSVGAGPLRSRLGKFFLWCVLRMVNYRSYRDAISKELVKQMGIRGDDPVVPDLAYSLRFSAPPETASPGRGLVIGINPVPYFDRRYWPEDDPTVYADYLKKLASLAAWLSERGHSVVLFPTQLRADPLVVDDILSLLGRNGHRPARVSRTAQPVASLDDLLNTIAGTDMVIASRYHGVVLSYLLYKPVVGIAYHKKTIELMKQMGQGEYALDVTGFDIEALTSRVLRLEHEASEVRRQIERRLPELRAAVDAQFDRVLSLVSP